MLLFVVDYYLHSLAFHALEYTIGSCVQSPSLYSYTFSISFLCLHACMQKIGFLCLFYMHACIHTFPQRGGFVYLFRMHADACMHLHACICICMHLHLHSCMHLHACTCVLNLFLFLFADSVFCNSRVFDKD